MRVIALGEISSRFTLYLLTFAMFLRIFFEKAGREKMGKISNDNNLFQKTYFTYIYIVREFQFYCSLASRLRVSH